MVGGLFERDKKQCRGIVVIIALFVGDELKRSVKRLRRTWVTKIKKNKTKIKRIIFSRDVRRCFDKKNIAFFKQFFVRTFFRKHLRAAFECSLLTEHNKYVGSSYILVLFLRYSEITDIQANSLLFLFICFTIHTRSLTSGVLCITIVRSIGYNIKIQIMT